MKNLQLYFIPIVEELVQLQNGIACVLKDDTVIDVCAELLFTTGDYPANAKLTCKNQKSKIGASPTTYRSATPCIKKYIFEGACLRCTLEGETYEKRVVYRSRDQVRPPRMYSKADSLAVGR